MSKRWLMLWCLWLGQFVVLEYFATKDKRPGGTTLSEFVWSIIVAHPIAWVLFAAFLAWLTLHFLSQGRIG